MHIKHLLMALSLTTALAQPAFAVDHSAHADMAAEHGGGIFHMFRLETDVGSNTDGTPLQSWDLDGWIGTDENKLWIKSEGERADNKLESAEFWALYSRNISTFWDAQAGIRYDTKPESTAYLTLGLNGLAPYWFETEAHLFVSEHGDVTARLRQENDLLLTQKLILQPYVEVNLSAQDVHEQDIGAGVPDGKIGLQTRYEFTRKFAPYVDVHYGRKFGETSSIAKSHGEDNDELVGSIGLRLMF
ncbi:MAG: copper resistance protein B [Alphaproteobacteria bacterium]|jgi:copper resistance protein B|nr:copper resistance protein B [Alphaproteobacteria bacterium]MCE3005326.1 copper resistance protein B [Rickettsiales bacterium]